MNTNADISVDCSGVAVRVAVSREVFDEVDAPEKYSCECYDSFWVKVARGNNVNVVFTTYEPPEEAPC